MHGSLNHRATGKFWDRYQSLPAAVQRLADSAYELLKADYRHPSLQLKVVGRYWSVRVGLHYRALAIRDRDDLVWFWIGHHSEYDRLIGGS
jgi:hypothetical protein